MDPRNDTKDVHVRSRNTLLMVGGIVSVAGTVVFVASALIMVSLWVALLFGKMGSLGAILGVLTAPVAVAYPFLHWGARGQFPFFYFFIWLIGIVGMIASMMWAVYGRPRVSHRTPGTPEAGVPRRVVAKVPSTKRAVD